MIDELERLFHPSSMAVVGASTKKTWNWSSGNSWIVGSIKMGFRGAIYPVHPSAQNVLGFRVYRSVLDIPGEVDLAVFTIPSAAVLDTVRQCVQKRVKFIHLMTAGFAETGLEQLARTETELVEIARSGGARIIGPNCMGVYCPSGGLSWSDEFPVKPGPVGFLSQSGQMAYRTIRMGRRVGVRFSKVISFGNACDLKAHQFLSHIGRDQDTRVIGAYLEGLKDGREFLRAVRETVPHKPLVVWKGGQTEGGSRAALSHTSAIAGSRKIWDAFCAQMGIVQVCSLEEMIFALRTLQIQPPPAGANVALLGGAGGGSVTTTDFAEQEGVSVPQLSDATVAGFAEFVPVHGTSVKNPLDIMPYIQKKKNLFRVMELLRDETNIDALIWTLVPTWVYRDRGPTGVSAYLGAALECRERLQKPLFFVLESDEDDRLESVRTDAMKWLSQHGAAVFPEFRLAARVLRKMKQYGEHLRKPG